MNADEKKTFLTTARSADWTEKGTLNEATPTELNLIAAARSIPLATSVPPPTPSPTIKPTLLENFRLENGIYVSTPEFTPPGHDSVCVLHYNLNGKVTYGTKVSLEYRRRSKYPLAISGKKVNIKTFRAWPKFDLGGRYPNIYYGCPDASNVAANSYLVYTEPLTPVNGRTRFYVKPWPCGDDKWHAEYIELKIPSGQNMADGALKFVCDGVTYLDVKTWQMNDSTTKDVIDWFCIQDNLSNASWPADSYVQVTEPVVTVS